MTEKRSPQRSPVHPSVCNLAKAFDLIGDRWSLLILRSALYGVQRFDDLLAENGMTRNILSDRLNRLVANGLLQKRRYKIPGQRARFAYEPAPATLALIMPFIALTAWADQWIDPNERKPVRFVDRATGQPVSIGPVDRDGNAVALEDIQPVFSV